MVGVQVASNEAERRGLIGRALNLARGEGASGVAVDQQAKEQFGGIGRAAARGIASVNRREVELGDDVHDEARQVIGGQTIAQAHRLVEGRLVVNGFEASTHRSECSTPDRSGEGFSPTNC